ncbi:MAG: DUF87 domain-containing protein [Candidatus Micrarchaeota archaeon]|nr:DUF87 domain-containing protein [Candidatus Micrarchaeota archaeon]
MGRSATISSSEISKLAHFPHFGEPDTESILSARREIYVGGASFTAAPLFLDISSAINPHIFVFGMSGSGKSYLLKSLIVRMAMFSNYRVVLIDFTGEYSGFSDDAGGERVSVRTAVRAWRRRRGLFYLDLSGLAEAERSIAAAKVLESISEQMRRNGVAQEPSTFIVLDEAWKVLLKCDVLETMIRESRKYGVGLVLASQIIGDIDEKFLANIATIFVFRTHDAAGLGRLGAAYSMDDGEMRQIKELDVGGCMFLQLRKDSQRQCFVIGRVMGVKRYCAIVLNCGGDMEMSFEEREIAEMARHAGVGEDATKALLARIKESGAYSLQRLLADLVGIGADRGRMLEALRRMRITDEQIADAFSAAVAGMV